MEMVKGPRLDAPKGSRNFEDPDLSFEGRNIRNEPFFLGLLLSHSMPDVVLSIAKSLKVLPVIVNR